MKAPRPAVRRSLLVALLLALLAHAAALSWLSLLLQPPTLLRPLAPPMYTRVLQAEGPAPRLPAALRWLLGFRAVRRVPARLVGYGVRPEHVRSPATESPG